MRIEGPNVGSINEMNLHKTKSTTPTATTYAATSADSVELSGTASAVSAARQVISSTPDIRTDKVAALRQQVQNGTYHVSALDIAKKMLAEGRLSELGQK